MHVFLWVYSKFNISSYGVNPFLVDSCTKHKYFYIFTPKQVKSVEITPNKQETPQDWVRLSLIGCIEFLCLTQSGIFLAPRTPTQTDRYALAPKQEQHQTQVYKYNYI